MSKTYSKQELEEIYNATKPTREEELELAIRLKGNDILYPILNEMLNRIKDQEERLTRVELKLNIQELPINLSEIQDTLERVKDYLRKNKEAYPSEIADSLGVSVKDVMKALSVLKYQEKVEVVE